MVLVQNQVVDACFLPAHVDDLLFIDLATKIFYTIGIVVKYVFWSTHHIKVLEGSLYHISSWKLNTISQIATNIFKKSIAIGKNTYNFNNAPCKATKWKHYRIIWRT